MAITIAKLIGALSITDIRYKALHGRTLDNGVSCSQRYCRTAVSESLESGSKRGIIDSLVAANLSQMLLYRMALITN